jgi:hypothetical protein
LALLAVLAIPPGLGAQEENRLEADAEGECILPPTGQPTGQKALDKLSEPRR